MQNKLSKEGRNKQLNIQGNWIWGKMNDGHY